MDIKVKVKQNESWRKENGDEDSDFNLGLCYQEIEEYEKAFQEAEHDNG